jgi:hypothetical protein
MPNLHIICMKLGAEHKLFFKPIKFSSKEEVNSAFYRTIQGGAIVAQLLAVVIKKSQHESQCWGANK